MHLICLCTDYFSRPSCGSSYLKKLTGRNVGITVTSLPPHQYVSRLNLLSHREPPTRRTR